MGRIDVKPFYRIKQMRHVILELTLSGRFVNRKWLSRDRENYICPKYIMGYRIDHSGVGVLRAVDTYPVKIDSITLPPPPPGPGDESLYEGKTGIRKSRLSQVKSAKWPHQEQTTRVWNKVTHFFLRIFTFNNLRGYLGENPIETLTIRCHIVLLVWFIERAWAACGMRRILCSNYWLACWLFYFAEAFALKNRFEVSTFSTKVFTLLRDPTRNFSVNILVLRGW